MKKLLLIFGLFGFILFSCIGYFFSRTLTIA